MTLTPARKTALVLATVWTPVFFVAYSYVMVSSIWNPAWQTLMHDPAWAKIVLYVLTPLELVTIVGALAVTGLYVHLALERPAGRKSARAAWVAAVILGGAVGQLVFFFVKLRKDGAAADMPASPAGEPSPRDAAAA